MQNVNGDETLEAEEAFEYDCETRGVKPKHYHADNG